jgi:hypothetical protein
VLQPRLNDQPTLDRCLPARADVRVIPVCVGILRCKPVFSGTLRQFNGDNDQQEESVIPVGVVLVLLWLVVVVLGLGLVWVVRMIG